MIKIKYPEQLYIKVWKNYYGDLKKGKDPFGTIIFFEKYGEQAKNGWELDHIYPETKKGSNDSNNFQPLHWKNNQIKANNLEGNINNIDFLILQGKKGVDNKIIGKMMIKK